MCVGVNLAAKVNSGKQSYCVVEQSENSLTLVLHPKVKCQLHALLPRPNGLTPSLHKVVYIMEKNKKYQQFTWITAIHEKSIL